jgi:hypothetical protein
VRRCLQPCFPICLLLFLASCSETNTIHPEDLRSEIRSSISLASETEWFIGQVQEGRITRQFAKTHLDYLSEEVMHSRKELNKSPADSGIAGRLEACRMQLDALGKELATIKADSEDRAGLSVVKKQIAQTRRVLEEQKEQ